MLGGGAFATSLHQYQIHAKSYPKDASAEHLH